MISLTIDSKKITTYKESSILKACLENDIYVPNLCYMDSKQKPAASCRMCFVEIEGYDEPAAACAITAQNDMRVKTDTPAVRRLQISGLKLLLSVHDVDCKNCHANKKCELQRIAKFLKVGLKAKPLQTILKSPEIIQLHPTLDYYPNRCVLCGKCIEICKNKSAHPMLTFAERGFDTVIGSFNPINFSNPVCSNCAKCVAICPVGALQIKKSAS